MQYLSNFTQLQSTSEKFTLFILKHLLSPVS